MTISPSFVQLAPETQPASAWLAMLEAAFIQALPAGICLAVTGGAALVMHGLARVTAFS